MNGQPWVGEVLAEQTGQGERVLDEHMYRIETTFTSTTMRLRRLILSHGRTEFTLVRFDVEPGWTLSSGSSGACRAG